MNIIAGSPGQFLGVFLPLLGSFPALALAAATSSPSATTNSTGNENEPNSTTTTTTTSTFTSWESDPPGRGTFSLIFSCIVTLTLCVWSALHLNVPTQNASLRWRILEKFKWVLYGIFAPELVVATAAAQFIVARWLKKEIEKDAKHRAGLTNGSKTMSSHTWGMSQCFFAVMGGFAAESPWLDFRSPTISVVSGDLENGTTKKRVTVTPEGIRLLSFLGRLPHIDKSQIEDKSKADWMAKSIICIQAGWMIIQVIGRAIKGMPVSLLEINTCGHVVCALCIYLLWFKKPLDIQEPAVIDDDEDTDALSLMYLCSRISSVNDITDIRCFIHVANEQDEAFWRLPEDRPSPAENAQATSDATSETQITTFLSIGSPGSRNPFKFLGFNELWSDEDQPEIQQIPTGEETKERKSSSRKPEHRAFRYNFNISRFPISTDCRIYYEPPYTSTPQPSLRHSHYCRQALQQSQSAGTSPQQAHTPLPLALLHSASAAADLLRAECANRPAHQPYYFTRVPSLGFFLGETEYLVRDRIPNLPPLENLGLGHVDIHRDRLRSVLALTAAAYGALHCAGWGARSHGELFPSRVEMVLWWVSSLVIAGSGVVLWGFFGARQLWPRFEGWVDGVRGSDGLGRESERRWVGGGWRAVGWVVLGVFAVARVFLVVEAFVSLRRAPRGLYVTPEWTDFLPHL